jgi:twitching motility protein PilT
MDRAKIDALITDMLETADRVSDLLFITDKPALIETDGRLIPFTMNQSDGPLTSQFIDVLAEQIIGTDERLLADYESAGSCDCSYMVENIARFRVNIYKENNRRAIVMRKLQPEVPSLTALGLPSVFQEIVKEKMGSCS